MITWSNNEYGGNSSSVANSINSGVIEIFSTQRAFAALKSDGSVITWGGLNGQVFGNNSSSVANSINSGVIDISSNQRAFAALKSDGSVITWGDSFYGGNSSSVASSINSGVIKIFPGARGAFAALKSNGSLVTWGNSDYGGDSSSVSSDLSSGVTQVFSAHGSNGRASFAALKGGSEVVSWGNYIAATSTVSASISSGVKKVFSNQRAVFALKTNGSVVTWGSSGMGGNSSSVASSLSSGVKDIIPAYYAAAALKDDGSVVTWGGAGEGGSMSSPVNAASSLTSGVKKIVSNFVAFAALKSDGSVVTWGNSLGGNSSSVSSDLSSGVIDVIASNGAFKALKSDGSVVGWGNAADGSAGTASSGVKKVIPASKSFAAIKDDGSVVVWSNNSSYGNGSLVTQVTQIGSDITTTNPSVNYYFGRKLSSTPSMDHIVTGTTSYFESGGVSAPIGMVEVYQLVSGAWQRKGNRIKGDAYNGSNNLFGWQVSISSNGNRIAVISRNQNNTAASQTDNGAIYIYEYNSSTQNWDLLNTIWGVSTKGITHAKMTPDGENIIYESDDTVKVLEYTPSGVSSWTQVGQNLSIDATGLDISDNGQRIIVENNLANNVRGEIYIYDYNTNNNQWGLIQTLSGESDYDRLGGSETKISGDGETIISSETHYDSTDDEGRLKVWKYNSSASPKWSLTGIPSEFLGEGTDHYFAVGVSVNYDGSRIAAGSAYSFGGRSNNGYIKVFNYTPSGTNSWTLVQTGTSTWTQSNGIFYGDDDTSWGDRIGANHSIMLSSDGLKIVYGAYGYNTFSGRIQAFNIPNTASGAKEVVGKVYGFAVLKSDGSVEKLGTGYGGDSSIVTAGINSGVKKVFALDESFAALKADGSVIAWGTSNKGGNLNTMASGGAGAVSSGVKNIYGGVSSFKTFKGSQYYNGAQSNFVALKSDGSISTWGSLQGAGSRTNYPPSITNAKVIDGATVTSNFAILKSNGSVETFGASYGADSSSVSSKLSSGIIEIVASGGGYAVRKYPNPVSPATLTITSNDSDNVITSGQVTLTATFSQNMTASPTISISGVVTNVAMTQSTTAAVWTYYWQVPSNISSGTTLNVTATATDTNNLSYSGNASLTLTISPTFYLASNGVTIKCSGCSAGDTGMVSGTIYTAVE